MEPKSSDIPSVAPFRSPFSSGCLGFVPISSFSTNFKVNRSEPRSITPHHEAYRAIAIISSGLEYSHIDVSLTNAEIFVIATTIRLYKNRKSIYDMPRTAPFVISSVYYYSQTYDAWI